MISEKIIKKTFGKFYAVTSVATIGMAFMGLLNILIASLCYAGDGNYAIGIALPVIIFTEIITFFFGVGGGIAVSIKLGRGEKEEASHIFSAAVSVTALIGIVIAILGAMFTKSLLPILGAKTAAEQAVVLDYVRILLCGMPVILLAGVMTVFVRNDNSPRFAMMGTVTSIFVNLILLFLFIEVFKMPLYSIALATVFANAVCVVMYLLYFAGKKSTLKFTRQMKLSCLKDLCEPGLSGSLIFLAQTVLTVFINNILLATNGAQGIATYAIVKYIITFIYGIYDSVTHSAQPMFGVYYGERDKFSILETAKIASRFMLISAAALCGLLVLGAPVFSKIFSLNATFAIRMTGISCLFSWFITFLNGYYRSTGKSKLSVLFIALDNLLFPAGLVFLFVYPLGLTKNGVWLALLASEVLTLVIILIVTKGRVLLSDRFTQKDDTVYQKLILNKEANIVMLNDEIKEFCGQNGVDAKRQYYIFLCIEEIAVNIIKHGFTDGKEHYIDIKIVISGADVMLNIRDDAIGFDPTQKTDADITSSAEEREIGGLGIFLVKKCSKEFSYKRVIGFNNLHIVL